MFSSFSPFDLTPVCSCRTNRSLYLFKTHERHQSAFVLLLVQFDYISDACVHQNRLIFVKFDTHCEFCSKVNVRLFFKHFHARFKLEVRNPERWSET